MIVSDFAEFNGETDFCVSVAALGCVRIESKRFIVFRRVDDVISVGIRSESLSALIEFTCRCIYRRGGFGYGYRYGLIEFLSAVSESYLYRGIAFRETGNYVFGETDDGFVFDFVCNGVFIGIYRRSVGFKHGGKCRGIGEFEFYIVEFNDGGFSRVGIDGYVEYGGLAVCGRGYFRGTLFKTDYSVAVEIKHVGVVYGVNHSRAVVGRCVKRSLVPGVDHKFGFVESYFGIFFFTPFDFGYKRVVETAERYVVSFAYIEKESIFLTGFERLDIIRPVTVSAGGVGNLLLIIIEKKLAFRIEDFKVSVAVRRMVCGFHRSAVSLTLIIVIPEKPYVFAVCGIVGVFDVFITETVMIRRYRGIYYSAVRRAERIEFYR